MDKEGKGKGQDHTVIDRNRNRIPEIEMEIQVWLCFLLILVDHNCFNNWNPKGNIHSFYILTGEMPLDCGPCAKKKEPKEVGTWTCTSFTSTIRALAERDKTAKFLKKSNMLILVSLILWSCD